MNETRTHVLQNLLKKITTKKAENVEKSIYNYTIQYANAHDIDKIWSNVYFNHIYKLKACEIIDSLDDETIRDIECKKISAASLAFLSEHTQEEAVLENDVEDGIFQCRKCGSKKTSYYSLQTRSADEPMTNFITCIQCKNRWKM